MKLYKLLSLFFLVIAPIIITISYFFTRQENAISFHFGGIVLSILIVAMTYNRFKEWMIIKRTAKETADNLGQVSKNYNPLIINLIYYIYLASPFGIVLWLSYLIKNYDGKIELPIIFILLSFLVSMILRYIADITQQARLSVDALAKQEADNDALAELIKSKL